MHNSHGASLIHLRYVQPPLIVRGGGFGGCAEVGGVKLKLLNSLQNHSVSFAKRGAKPFFFCLWVDVGIDHYGMCIYLTNRRVRCPHRTLKILMTLYYDAEYSWPPS